MKVEVAVSNSPFGVCGRKATFNHGVSELRSCVKVEVAVPNSPFGVCGRKATFNHGVSEFRSCLKVEVAVLGSLSLIVLNMVSEDVKQH